MNRSLTAMVIHIGKKGVNEQVIEEIKRQLKNNEIIKLRFARNIADEKKTYIDKITENTRSKLVDLRGNVAVIYKKK